MPGPRTWNLDRFAGSMVPYRVGNEGLTGIDIAPKRTSFGEDVLKGAKGIGKFALGALPGAIMPIALNALFPGAGAISPLISSSLGGLLGSQLVNLVDPTSTAGKVGASVGSTLGMLPADVVKTGIGSGLTKISNLFSGSSADTNTKALPKEDPFKIVKSVPGQLGGSTTTIIKTGGGEEGGPVKEIYAKTLKDVISGRDAGNVPLTELAKYNNRPNTETYNKLHGLYNAPGGGLGTVISTAIKPEPKGAPGLLDMFDMINKLDALPKKTMYYVNNIDRSDIKKLAPKAIDLEKNMLDKIKKYSPFSGL